MAGKDHRTKISSENGYLGPHFKSKSVQFMVHRLQTHLFCMTLSPIKFSTIKLQKNVKKFFPNVLSKFLVLSWAALGTILDVSGTKGKQEEKMRHRRNLKPDRGLEIC